MHISIVVAVSDNNAIGAGGALLWRLPKDMQYFKEVTTGLHNPLVLLLCILQTPHLLGKDLK